MYTEPRLYLTVMVQVDQDGRARQFQRRQAAVPRPGKDMRQRLARQGVAADKSSVEPDRQRPPTELHHIGEASDEGFGSELFRSAPAAPERFLQDIEFHPPFAPSGSASRPAGVEQNGAAGVHDAGGFRQRAPQPPLGLL